FLLTIVVPILTIGIVIVTSASFIIASDKYGDGFYYAKKQGFAMVMGIGLMYLCSMVNPALWRRVANRLMIGGIVLLVLVFVPGIGVELGGSHRWIRLPFGLFFQPSEVIKYALILFFANSLAKKGEGIRDFAIGFLPHVLTMGVVVFLILMQPDFGTAVIITAVGFLMLFVAGVRMQHLLGSAILCLPFLVQMAISADYRWSRIRSFLDPWEDPLNSGFQIIQSLMAFACGGFWGVGIGKGIQKLRYLPQPHTDFIFSMVGEELGLVGVLLLILLFYLLICRGLVAAIRAADPFLRYVAFGITSLIGLQAMLNMAVAMGMLPTKGLPLPFVSLGGTSLVMNLAGLGILMAITRANQTRPQGEAQ
ncbi:MAG: putative lipid II flippase FtsW, partial [Deltaproteobacteria bacterium]|nr:putative lipid II flippase FtsW [Deltaproteobacteria bacterium]